MYSFDYVRPSTLEEAKAILASHPEARPVSGGQTLLPTLKQRLANPELLVDLQKIPDLRGVEITSTHVCIGAMTRHAEVAANADIARAIPALAYLAGGIADPQVRHMGTMGGSLANNDPAADYPGAVMGLGAEIVTSRRTIAADDFFLGLFTTALEPGEFICQIRYPRVERAGYHKFAQPASGYVVTGCFVSRDFQGQVRVAVNGAGPCVFRQSDFENALVATFDTNSIDRCQQGSTGLNTDLHASAAYRAQLVKVAARRAVTWALAAR
ncbi:MAG: xanthine dehydrogenase family protein subunit M [Pusillimonas sp.]